MNRSYPSTANQDEHEDGIVLVGSSDFDSMAVIDTENNQPRVMKAQNSDHDFIEYSARSKH